MVGLRVKAGLSHSRACVFRRRCVPHCGLNLFLPESSWSLQMIHHFFQLLMLSTWELGWVGGWMGE